MQRLFSRFFSSPSASQHWRGTAQSLGRRKINKTAFDRLIYTSKRSRPITEIVSQCLYESTFKVLLSYKLWHWFPVHPAHAICAHPLRPPSTTKRKLEPQKKGCKRTNKNNKAAGHRHGRIHNANRTVTGCEKKQHIQSKVFKKTVV